MTSMRKADITFVRESEDQVRSSCLFCMRTFYYTGALVGRKRQYCTSACRRRQYDDNQAAALRAVDTSDQEGIFGICENLKCKREFKDTRPENRRFPIKRFCSDSCNRELIKMKRTGEYGKLIKQNIEATAVVSHKDSNGELTW